MKRLGYFCVFLVMALALVGCGGGVSSGSSGGSTQSAVFVTGEDAPLPSVVAFNITLNSITLNNSSGSVPVLSQPTTVDFARLVGMRSLLAFNTVAPGTYTSATFTLANPVISYLNVGTNPPTVSTLNGTLTSSTVTVSFAAPLVVTESGLAGLHMDFDLRQSLETDMAGQVTGTVDPHIFVQVVRAGDDGGQITDLRGGLVSVNVGSNSFVMQRIGGLQITVKVNSQTQFNGSWSLSNMVTPAFLSVEGTIQADGSILASEVEVISTDHAFLSGRILAVNPTTGPAQTVTMFVGEELPAISQIPVDSVVTLDVSQVTHFDVCFFDNWFTNFLFNNSSLVVGQRVFIGGGYDGTTFTSQMISLRRQGVVGDLVSNSVNIVSGNQGTFQLQNNFLLGYVLGAPLTVQTGNGTRFVNINGLSGLQAAGSINLVVRGLILKDQNGAPQMWAHRVRVLH
jgi:Domain of unknown function (DUF5666)/Domain of unknown function (DUF4382)